MRALRHVTLTTGHVRDSLPDEVSGEAIAACEALIAQVTAGEAAEPAPIPGHRDYYLSGRRGGKCLVLTVWHHDSHAPIATIGIATHSRCGAQLWRELHRWGETPVVTDPERCPAEPWVAAALDAGIAQHPDAARWLGDFGRCIGWAWLRMRDGE